MKKWEQDTSFWTLWRDSYDSNPLLKRGLESPAAEAKGHWEQMASGRLLDLIEDGNALLEQCRAFHELRMPSYHRLDCALCRARGLERPAVAIRHICAWEGSHCVDVGACAHHRPILESVASHNSPDHANL